MSKEIKMIEVFELPVRRHYATIVDVNEIRSVGTEELNAAVIAINKHDRLTEENKRLRDTMARLISSGVAFQNLDEMDNALDSDDIASIEANFNDELIRADKLLSELEGGKDE